jgi:hypothetical protein
MCAGIPLDTDDREHWPTYAQRGVFLRLNTLPCPYLFAHAILAIGHNPRLPSITVRFTLSRGPE